MSKIENYKNMLSDDKIRDMIENMMVNTIINKKNSNSKTYNESLADEAQNLSQLFKYNNYNRKIIDLFDDMSIIAEKQMAQNIKNSNEKDNVVENNSKIFLYNKNTDLQELLLLKTIFII